MHTAAFLQGTAAPEHLKYYPPVLHQLIFFTVYPYITVPGILFLSGTQNTFPDILKGKYPEEGLLLPSPFQLFHYRTLESDTG